MDNYGKKLIEQGACEERKTIIKKLEGLVVMQKETGMYSAGCPSIELALDIIRGRNEKPNERKKIAEELKNKLAEDHSFPTDDHGTRMWRLGWQDAAEWIERGGGE